MPEVFISYCRADGDFAEVLRRRLAEAGFASWIDLEEIQPGEEWAREIDDALRQSTAVIVVLSPAAHESAYVTFEWSFALGAGVAVIPVVLERGSIHPRLSALHHLDFTRRDARPWDALVDAVRAAVEARPTQAVPVPRSAPAVVREAAAALDHADAEVQRAAVLRLAQLSLPEARDALVAALRHPLPEVRIEAAWQLARQGDPRAVSALIEGNRRRRWHHEFARRIRDIGAAALPELRAAAADPEAWMRRDIVWAMEGLGDTAVIPDITARLREDTDAEVRLAAAQALRTLGTSDAEAAIAAALPGFIRDLREGPRSIQWRVAEFLGQLDEPEARAAAAQWKREGERPGDGAGRDSTQT